MRDNKTPKTNSYPDGRKRRSDDCTPNQENVPSKALKQDGSNLYDQCDEDDEDDDLSLLSAEDFYDRLGNKRSYTYLRIPDKYEISENSDTDDESLNSTVSYRNPTKGEETKTKIIRGKTVVFERVQPAEKKNSNTQCGSKRRRKG